MTWKSTALLEARSALFPDRAMTILGLACLCSSFTQFFARAKDSCKTHTMCHELILSLYIILQSDASNLVSSCPPEYIQVSSVQLSKLRACTDAPRLWCRRPRWRLVLLCNTWAPNCGTAPDLQCPRFQTSLSCHLDTLSGWEKPLRGQNEVRGWVGVAWRASKRKELVTFKNSLQKNLRIIYLH